MGKDETARDIYEMGMAKVPTRDPQLTVGDRASGINFSDR